MNRQRVQEVVEKSPEAPGTLAFPYWGKGSPFFVTGKKTLTLWRSNNGTSKPRHRVAVAKTTSETDAGKVEELLAAIDRDEKGATV